MKRFQYLPIFCVFVLLISIISVPSAYALEDPATESKAIVLLDAATGNSIYTKNADERAYPASLTKVMTTLLAVEAIERGEVSPDDTVTCAENIHYDTIEEGSTANIQAGETMTLKNLLYCAMVASANEACNAIAAYISGSIPDFIVLMNDRAEELGCTGTHFANTHGLPNTGHYTTAADFAKIAYEAYRHKLFMEICNTVKTTVPATNMSAERKLGNTNGLINPNSQMYSGYIYEYAAGIKTGHTDDAGYCLASTAHKDGIDLLCVVMGGKAMESADGTKYSSFTDTIGVYNWAFANYSYREILKLTDLVEEVPVSMGSNGSFVTVHPKDTVRVLIPNDDNLENFEQIITIYSERDGQELVAPVEAYEVLGEIQIVRDGVVCGSSYLVASSTIELSYSEYIGHKIANTLKNPLVILFIVVVLALIIGYIYLLLRYRKSKKEYLKARKRRIEEARIRAERQARQSNPVRDPRRGAARLDQDGRTETWPENTGGQAERDYFDEFFGKK